MSLRNRVNPQQLLAVSFALIMLVSMGGMAFVGGAGAQATGGTFEDIAPDEESINDDQNIADGTGDVVTLSNGGTGVAVNDDGSVDFSPPGAANFAGVAIDEDRYAALFDGVDANAGPADQLNALDDVSIASGGTTGISSTGSGTSGAYPAVLIELAPQSEFSQVTDFSGDEDYVLIVGEASGLTSGSEPVGVFTVNNDGPTTTEIAAGSSFGTAIDGLGLENDNIDQVRIGAGIGAQTVLSDAGTVDGFTSSTVSDIDVTVDGETRLVHNEKIALDDGQGDNQFFATIDNTSTTSASGALQAAADGDQIIVDTGDYSALEAAPITVNKDVTITGATSGNVDTRLDDTLSASDYVDDETVIGTDIQLASDGATLENLVVGNPGNAGGATQQITNDGTNAANVTIEDTIVNGPAASTAIDLTSVADARTVDNVAVIGNTAGPSGGIGLNVDDAGDLTVENSFFAGYQTQVNGAADVNETAIFDSNQFSHAAVPVNETGVVIGDQIAGVINDADGVAEAGNTIEVTSDGIFSNYDVDSDNYDNSVTLNNAADLSLVDVDDGATISDSVSVNSAGEVSIEGFTVEDSNLDTDGSASAISVNGTDIGTGTFDLDSIATVELNGTTGGHYALGPDGSAETVNISDAAGTEFSIDSTANVDLDQVDAESDSPVTTLVDVDTSEAGDVSVTNSNIRNLNASDSGLDINAAAVNSETVTVSNVTVTGAGDAGTPTGIALSNIDTTVDENEYVLRNNELTALNNGFGIDLDEDSGSDNGAVIVDANEIRSSGTDFIGLAYNMPNTQTVNITANTIVGGDVAGAQNSVGVNFEEVAPFSSSNVFQTGSDDVMTFEDNVITGHARLIQDEAANSGNPTIQASGYNAILTSDELNNSYGTHVVGANGATYAETYGQPTATGGNEFETGSTLDGSPESYVPGSVDQAVDLVAANADNTGADLIVTETDVGVSGPDTYDDESVELPDLSGISITGAAADGSVTVDTDFSIDQSGAENNHSVSDLTIVNDDGGSAIDIQSDNAQVDFDNLDVTSTGDGLTVATSENDVNVVNVTNSAFNVTETGTNGIVLNSGTGDDRDGFVIDNVTVDGPGIGADSSTGLDLTGVDKPGKDGLPVNLTVTDSELTDFETIVALDGGVDTDAEAFLDRSSVGVDGVTINSNTFEQAIVVDADVPSLYGSLDQADEDANADDTIEVVGTGLYDHDDPDTTAEDGEVTIGTNGVTVTGPATTEGQSTLRSSEAIILNPVVVSSADTSTLEGLTVVPQSSDEFTNQLTGASYGATEAGTQQAVIAHTGGDLTVRDISVSTGLPTDGDTALPVGIGASEAASSLTVERTFVGDHEADIASTTGSGVVAQSTTTFTLRDSELAGGSEADNAGASAYGVLAGSSTEPSISSTEITNFDQAGVNTQSDNPTVRNLAAGDTLTITGDELETEGALANQSDTSSYSDAFGDDATNGFLVQTFESDSAVRSLTFTFELDGTYTDNSTTPNTTIDQLVVTYDGSATADTYDDGDFTLVGVNSTSGNETTLTGTDQPLSSNTATSLPDALAKVDTVVQNTDPGVASFQIDLTQESGVGTISQLTINDTVLIDSDDARILRVVGGEITDNGGDGIETDDGFGGARTEQYLVSGTLIENNAAGIDLDSVGLDFANTVEVRSNQDGVVVDDAATVSVTDAIISDNTNAGVALGSDTAVDTATVQDNDIDNNGDGISVDGVATSADITQNTIENNDVGLDVASIAGTIDIKSNDFLTNEETDISSEDEIDATLNYFGTDLGPNDAAGVDDTVTYDPFLTESKLDTSATDVADTTSFGHDVVIPGGDSIVSVGFPAEPQADTVGEVINGNVAGAVYKWDQSAQQFDNVGMNAPVGAFDVLVVENRDDKPTTAAITYKDESARNDPVDNTFTFKEGFNFVPAQQTGTVDEALFAGDGSDYVAQPFSSGENLYGDRDADQVRDEFASPSEDGFGANFASGVGDEIVHPHTGYFVIVNEESNIGNTRSEQIPSAGVPTAANIDERTGATPATFELSSASVTSNASGNGDVDVIVDVENIGDVEGSATLDATALTGFTGTNPADTETTANIAAGEDTTVQLTVDGTDLTADEQVRVEITVDGTDESVKVTTQAE